MTKLEELKAAYAASTQGEWDFHVADNSTPPYSAVTATWGEDLLRHRLGVTWQAQHDVSFIALAHNNMAALLEAVERLEAMQRVIGELAAMNPFLRDVFDTNKAVLEKLK